MPNSQLTLAAPTILGNEKAVELREVNEQSPGSKGPHRYQIITVIRDDQLAEWRKDMGPSKNWKGVRELRIPSLLEHTVDELFDLADDLRQDNSPQDVIDIKELLGLYIE